MNWFQNVTMYPQNILCQNTGTELLQ